MKYSIDNIPIEKIKNQLKRKKIKGKEYYYLDFKLIHPLEKNKEIYVCPVSCSENELKTSFCYAQHKGFVAFVEGLCECAEKYYESKYLNHETKMTLEYLRLGYNVIFKEYDSNQLENYKESEYAKYVQGTTSIEGNTYTLRETDLTLNEGMTVSGKTKREFYEIENYGRLKKYLEKEKSKIITINLIKKIHNIILENIDNDSAGHFRKCEVGIQGTMFEPVPGILVEDEMEKLINWYRKNCKKIHPIELAALFHQKFEEIHPFIDGNGRVGRELVRLIFEENNFPPLFVNMTNREEYLKSLDFGNDKDYKKLCDFFVKSLIESHKNLIKLANDKLQNDLSTQEKYCKICSHKKECNELLKTFSKFCILST